MSDQDFFFDEDEKPAAKAPVKRAGGATGAAKPAGKTAVPAAGPASTVATVTMTVAILIGVIGILIGAIGGIFIGRGLASTTVASPGLTAPAASGTGTGSGAPQLSPEQLQGDLPSGHPAIGSGAATTTPGK